ncbi:unnamed protein product [Amoebophrya sp. A120]|nr:unnamed protein product [Amoebophrya sp. A120]|eukprot:GSA120T00011667001.1
MVKTFTHTFPNWEDLPDDDFENTKLNSEIEQWCWQDRFGAWNFNANPKYREKIRINNDSLEYILKYIFVRKLRVAKRYPRTFSEFEDLRKKSYFFAKTERCYPTPVINSRTPETLVSEQRVKYIAGNPDDYVLFTGDYTKLIYFEDFLVADNDIGDVGMCHLADFFVAANVLVRNLRFFRNNVGELGALAMAGYMLKAPIHEFHASHNYIPKLGAVALVVAASSNPHFPLIFPEFQKWYKWKYSRDKDRYPLTDHGYQTLQETGSQARPCWMRLESNIIEHWQETRGESAQTAFVSCARMGHRLDPRGRQSSKFLTALREVRQAGDDVLCEIREKQSRCAPRCCCTNEWFDENNPKRILDIGNGEGKINMNWYRKSKIHLCYMNLNQRELEDRKRKAPPVAKIGYEGQCYRLGFQFFMKDLYKLHNLPLKPPMNGGFMFPASVREKYPQLTREGTPQTSASRPDMSPEAPTGRATTSATTTSSANVWGSSTASASTKHTAAQNRVAAASSGSLASPQGTSTQHPQASSQSSTPLQPQKLENNLTLPLEERRSDASESMITASRPSSSSCTSNTEQATAAKKQAKAKSKADVLRKMIEKQSREAQSKLAFRATVHPQNMFGDCYRDDPQEPEYKSRDQLAREFERGLDGEKKQNFLNLRQDFTRATVDGKKYKADELETCQGLLMKMWTDKLLSVMQSDEDFKTIAKTSTELFWQRLQHISAETFGYNTAWARGFAPFRALELLGWELAERMGMMVIYNEGIDWDTMIAVAAASKQDWIVTSRGYTSAYQGRWVKVPNIPKLLKWLLRHEGDLMEIAPGQKLNAVAQHFDDLHLQSLRKDKSKEMLMRINSVDNKCQQLLLTERSHRAWSHRLAQLKKFEELQEMGFVWRMFDLFAQYLLKIEVQHMKMQLYAFRHVHTGNAEKIDALILKLAKEEEKICTAGKNIKDDQDHSSSAVAADTSTSVKNARPKSARILKSKIAQQDFAELFGGDVYTKLCLCDPEVLKDAGIVIDLEHLRKTYAFEAYDNKAGKVARTLRGFLDRYFELIRGDVARRPAKYPNVGKTRLYQHPDFDPRLFISDTCLEKLCECFQRLIEGERCLLQQYGRAKELEQKCGEEENLSREETEQEYTAHFKLKEKQEKVLESTCKEKKEKYQKGVSHYGRVIARMQSTAPKWCQARARTKQVCDSIDGVKLKVIEAVALSEVLPTEDVCATTVLSGVEQEEQKDTVLDSALRLFTEIQQLKARQSVYANELEQTLQKQDESWRRLSKQMAHPLALTKETGQNEAVLAHAPTVPFLFTPCTGTSPPLCAPNVFLDVPVEKKQYSATAKQELFDCGFQIEVDSDGEEIAVGEPPSMRAPVMDSGSMGKNSRPPRIQLEPPSQSAAGGVHTGVLKMAQKSRDIYQKIKNMKTVQERHKELKESRDQQKEKLSSTINFNPFIPTGFSSFVAPAKEQKEDEKAKTSGSLLNSLLTGEPQKVQQPTPAKKPLQRDPELLPEPYWIETDKYLPDQLSIFELIKREEEEKNKSDRLLKEQEEKDKTEKLERAMSLKKALEMEMEKNQQKIMYSQYQQQEQQLAAGINSSRRESSLQEQLSTATYQHFNVNTATAASAQIMNNIDGANSATSNNNAYYNSCAASPGTDASMLGKSLSTEAVEWTKQMNDKFVNEKPRDVAPPWSKKPRQCDVEDNWRSGHGRGTDQKDQVNSKLDELAQQNISKKSTTTTSLEGITREKALSFDDIKEFVPAAVAAQQQEQDQMQQLHHGGGQTTAETDQFGFATDPSGYDNSAEMLDFSQPMMLDPYDPMQEQQQVAQGGTTTTQGATEYEMYYGAAAADQATNGAAGQYGGSASTTTSAGNNGAGSTTGRYSQHQQGSTSSGNNTSMRASASSYNPGASAGNNAGSHNQQSWYGSYGSSGTNANSAAGYYGSNFHHRSGSYHQGGQNYHGGHHWAADGSFSNPYAAYSNNQLGSFGRHQQGNNTTGKASTTSGMNNTGNNWMPNHARGSYYQNNNSNSYGSSSNTTINTKGGSQSKGGGAGTSSSYHQQAARTSGSNHANDNSNTTTASYNKVNTNTSSSKQTTSTSHTERFFQSQQELNKNDSAGSPQHIPFTSSVAPEQDQYEVAVSSSKSTASSAREKTSAGAGVAKGGGAASAATSAAGGQQQRSMMIPKVLSRGANDRAREYKNRRAPMESDYESPSEEEETPVEVTDVKPKPVKVKRGESLGLKVRAAPATLKTAPPGAAASMSSRPQSASSSSSSSSVVHNNSRNQNINAAAVAASSSKGTISGAMSSASSAAEMLNKQAVKSKTASSANNPPMSAFHPSERAASKTKISNAAEASFSANFRGAKSKIPTRGNVADDFLPFFKDRQDGEGNSAVLRESPALAPPKSTTASPSEVVSATVSPPMDHNDASSSVSEQQANNVNKARPIKSPPPAVSYASSLKKNSAYQATASVSSLAGAAASAVHKGNGKKSTPSTSSASSSSVAKMMNPAAGNSRSDKSKNRLAEEKNQSKIISSTSNNRLCEHHQQIVPQPRVSTITEETLETTCQICYDNENEMRFFDCWHEICRSCYESYFVDNNNTNCPVCRQLVLCFVPIEKASDSLGNFNENDLL